MKYAKADLADIITNMKPVDRLAVNVVSKGVQHNPDKKITQLHWDSCPPVKPLPKRVFDLRSVKFGRFTVVGFYGDHRKKLGFLWIVRCSCGAYEVRRERSITNPKNNRDCCDICRHLIYLKNWDEYRRHGFNE